MRPVFYSNVFKCTNVFHSNIRRQDSLCNIGCCGMREDFLENFIETEFECSYTYNYYGKKK